MPFDVTSARELAASVATPVGAEMPGMTPRIVGLSIETAASIMTREAEAWAQTSAMATLAS